MRDIARRKASIQSTGQITKAMKLVSTVKFQKARVKAESTKPYFDYMYATVSSILARTENINHRYLDTSGSVKKAIILITSNRGLAGGYNSNVVKLVTADDSFKPEDILLYTVGSKGRDSLLKKGYEGKKDFSEVLNQPIYQDAKVIGTEVLQAFENGEIGEIYLAYTQFKNTVSQTPKMVKLLPVEINEHLKSQQSAVIPMNFEPKEEEALDLIIPKYICSLIYGALMEAAASENGARMTAMDSATNNADELIDELELKYNQARQSAITNELTEIIAGAEAAQA